MKFATALSLTLIAGASAGCDNSCSGHGECDCGFCVCYDNWGLGMAYDTGDCSDRICPFELSWVDNPKAGVSESSYDTRHRYAECAGKGLCNRESGECECFDGYEGKGCQRTSCPNDCSGHGTCEYINELTFGATEFSHQHMEFTQLKQSFTYQGFDNSKVRGCVCDPQYGDVDCSKRMCPHGNDMMDRRLNQLDQTQYQTQRITFQFDTTAGIASKTFALTYKSRINETFTTIPITVNEISPTTMSSHIESALLGLPNGVVDGVHVHSDIVVGSPDSVLSVNVTFTGDSNQGQQNLLVVEDYTCSDGCTPQLLGIDLTHSTGNVTEHLFADYNSFECGRRGKCDYDSGVCECFEGFTGPSCGLCTSLI